MNAPIDDILPDADSAAADDRFVRRAGYIVVTIQILLLLATLALARA